MLRRVTVIVFRHLIGVLFFLTDSGPKSSFAHDTSCRKTPWCTRKSEAFRVAHTQSPALHMPEQFPEESFRKKERFNHLVLQEEKAKKCLAQEKPKRH